MASCDECVENPILEDVRDVNGNSAEEFRSFAADIARFEGQIIGNFMLQLQVPVLNVWSRHAVLKSRKTLRPVSQRYRLKRRDAIERQCNVPQCEKIPGRERVRISNAVNAAGNAFECEGAAATLVAHSITGAKNRTIFAPPGQRPAKTHGRRDIVRRIFVQL